MISFDADKMHGLVEAVMWDDDVDPRIKETLEKLYEEFNLNYFDKWAKVQAAVAGNQPQEDSTDADAFAKDFKKLNKDFIRDVNALLAFMYGIAYNERIRRYEHC